MKHILDQNPIGMTGVIKLTKNEIERRAAVNRLVKLGNEQAKLFKVMAKAARTGDTWAVTGLQTKFYSNYREIHRLMREMVPPGPDRDRIDALLSDAPHDL